MKSLLITVMRNAVLFIPAVVVLGRLWQLDGVIAAQPAVETILAIVCVAMYADDRRKSGMKASDSKVRQEPVAPSEIVRHAE